MTPEQHRWIELLLAIQKRLARVNVAIFALENRGGWYWVCLTGMVILDCDGDGDGGGGGGSRR